jgi:hypothetical protein
MTEILKRPAQAVEDQHELLWSDPEKLQDESIAAFDSLLGHDVDRLAALTGISRRQLNKQRERRPDLLSKQWLHRLAELFHLTAMKFGPERTAPALRLLNRAGGHGLAGAVPAAAARGERDAAIAVISRAVREACDAASKFADRAQDGLDRADARALLPDVDEALEEMQTARALLERLANPEIGPRQIRA